MRSNALRRLYPRRQDGLPCRVGVKMRRLCFSRPTRTTRPNAPALQPAPLWQSSRPSHAKLQATAGRNLPV